MLCVFGCQLSPNTDITEYNNHLKQHLTGEIPPNPDKGGFNNSTSQDINQESPHNEDNNIPTNDRRPMISILKRPGTSNGTEPSPKRQHITELIPSDQDKGSFNNEDANSQTNNRKPSFIKRLSTSNDAGPPHKRPRTKNFKCDRFNCDYNTYDHQHLTRHMKSHDNKIKRITSAVNHICPIEGCQYRSAHKTN